MAKKKPLPVPRPITWNEAYEHGKEVLRKHKAKQERYYKEEARIQRKLEEEVD